MLKRGMAFLVVSALLTAAPAMAWTHHAKGGGGGPTATSKTTSNAATSKTAAKLPTVERQFVEQAAAGDRTEIALGQFALKHAQSATTKQFANRIITDHSKDLKTVTDLAKKLNINLPNAEPAEVASNEKMLSSKKGIEFDAAYLTMMVREHTKDIAKYQVEAKRAVNPDVRSYAAAAVPTLKTHLALAEKDRRKV